MTKRPIWGFAALLLVGCGLTTPAPQPLAPLMPTAVSQVAPTPKIEAKATPAPAKAKEKTPAKPGQSAAASPTTSPTAKASAQPTVKTVMQEVQSAWQATRGLHVHAANWETDGRTESTNELEADILKPNRLHARIVKASDAGTVGTELSWSGGDSLRVKTKVLGISLTLTLPVTDKRLLSSRGWSLADTSVLTLMETVLKADAPVRYLGKAKMGEQMIDLIELQTPSLVPGIAKEHLGFDREQHALVLRELYAGDKVVSRCQYSQVQLTPPPASVFEL